MSGQLPRSGGAKRRGGAIGLHDIGMMFRGRDSDVTALAGVTLDIPAGSFCSVLGPSGCGKSTLLSLVAGLSSPTRGTVTVDGKPLDGPFHDVGIVFQSDVLLPWLTILENVLLPAKVKRQDMVAARERAEKLLHDTGLGEFGGAYPAELSGGDATARVHLPGAFATAFGAADG